MFNAEDFVIAEMNARRERLTGLARTRSIKRRAGRRRGLDLLHHQHHASDGMA